MNLKRNIGLALAAILMMAPAAAGSCQDTVSKGEGTSVGISQGSSQGYMDFTKSRLSTNAANYGVVNFEVLNEKGDVLYHPAVSVAFSDTGASEGASVSMTESSSYSDSNASSVTPSFSCSLSVQSLKREGDYIQMSVSGTIVGEAGAVTSISADKIRCKFGEPITLGTKSNDGKALYSIRITPFDSQKAFENQK
ncbi:hypothetical protein [Anaeromusa acidaminophila]|uniref:hypothetical protein n=1 Tax=Anaeromusa acidaminophila TaxID=81464 RepID=UPI000374D9A3|nr:hypothetical protein [Anaeromusa acidaminophila]